MWVVHGNARTCACYVRITCMRMQGTNIFGDVCRFICYLSNTKITGNFGVIFVSDFPPGTWGQSSQISDHMKHDIFI